MKWLIFNLVCLLLLTTIVSQAHLRAAEEKRSLLIAAEKEGEEAIPGVLLKLVSLEFDGLLADHLFLRCLTFTGRLQEDSFTSSGKYISEAALPLNTPRQWDWFVSALHGVSDLDPCFFDTYFIGFNNLVWTAKRYEDANRLLDRGIPSRYWDWFLPFNAGFNSFYFLNDKKKGSAYLMTASSRPDAPPILATLAARLAYEDQQTANAIIFLKQQLRDAESDDPTKKLLYERLEALEGIYAIEQAVDSYKQREGRLPDRIEMLVKTGDLITLPVDPYGGKFYLDKDGRVKTTSDLGKKRG